MTRGLACARVGLLPIIIGAWAPWALAQSSGIVWEAGFEPIHTVTAAWGGDRAVPSSFDQLATLAPGPDGNVYFFARNTSGQPVLSLLSSVDDTVIRQRTFASQQLGSYYDTLGGQSLGDGGALILRRGVTRFSSDGRLLWSRRIEAARFQPARVARFSNGDLVMTDQQTEDRAHKGWSIYRIDSLTGAVLNVRHFPSDATYGCAAIPLGVQSDDHVYVTDRCSDGTYRQRLIKLTPNLEPVWTRQWSASSAFDWMPNAGLIDAQGVVLERIGTTGRRELVRFRGGDGSIAWSRAGDWTALQAGSDGRWAGYVSNEDDRRLEGLDASTGAATWSHAVDVQDPILRIADNDVWIAGVDAAAAQGFVERRSLADGSILWRRELAGTQPGIYFRPGDVLVSEDQVRVAGESCPTDSSCAFGIKRLSRVTGNLQATSYPTSPQAASSDAAQDGDQWLAASLEDDPQGARVRAKRFDANGVLTWEHVFPADGARGRYQWARVRRMPDGDLLVVAGGRICCGHFARYSGDGETLRWRRSLTTDFYSPGHVAFDLDDAGDLLVSVSRNSGTGVYYGWIEKLDGASGVTLWRGGDAPSQLIDSGPRRFWLIGNDVFTFRIPHTARCGQLLSGSDGSRRWTDQCEFSSAFLGAQDGDIYLWAADGSISAVSVADGSVRWRRDVTGVGDEYAFVSGLVDGGDLYVGGSRVDGSGRAALLARIDRATGTVAWINRFAGPLGPPRAPITVREMSGGALIATQFDGMRTFVSRFDPGDGHFLDGRQLSTSDALDEAIPTEPGTWGPPTAGGDRFSVGEAYRPGLPSVPWTGRLIAPDAGRLGELSVSMANVPDAARPGDAFGLSVTIAHSGAQPMSDVSAFVHMGRPAVPAQSGRLGVSDLACEVVGGGTCDAVSTPGGIRVKLDLSPGASVRLTATVRVLAEGIVSVIAEAYAPYGWFDTQMRDNVAERTLVMDRIFWTDFD